MSRRREAAGRSVGGVEEAEDADPVGARRVELLARHLGHLEELLEAGEQALAARRVVGEAGEQAVGGEDGEAGVVEPGERHQGVVLRALAADLVAVGAGGLVAVVAVGDQQLGVGQRLDHGGDHGRVVDPPDPVDGAVGVGDLAPGLGGEGGLDQRPGVDGREREDRREVQVRRPRQFEAVLQRAGVGALVGADGPGLVVLDPDPGEHPVAGVRGAVGRGVVLGQRPDACRRCRRRGRPRRARSRSAAPRPRRDRRPAARPGSAGSKGTGRSTATAL